MKNIALLFLVLVAAGCNAKTESNNLSYEFSVNDCSTGKHEFSSREAYCDGLRNEGMNNGCARAEREDNFKKDCSGTFGIEIPSICTSADSIESECQ